MSNNHPCKEKDSDSPGIGKNKYRSPERGKSGGYLGKSKD
jgi:hypothetical protein